MKTIITILFLFCLPAFAQDGVLVKTTPVAWCEITSISDSADPLYALDCKGIEQTDWKFTIAVPKSMWMPAWEAPDPIKRYAVGRGTDNKLYAIATPKPEPPGVAVILPPSPCHSQTLRGEHCTGEMRRLHPANGLDVERAKRP